MRVLSFVVDDGRSERACWKMAVSGFPVRMTFPPKFWYWSATFPGPSRISPLEVIPCISGLAQSMRALFLRKRGSKGWISRAPFS